MTTWLTETGLNLTLMALSVGLMLGIFTNPPDVVVYLIRCVITTGLLMLAGAATLAAAGGVFRYTFRRW